MNIRRPLISGLGLLLALALSSATVAAPRSNLPLGPVEGEVIVAFKPDAGTVRKYALAARAADGDRDGDRATTQAALEGRAATLGARVGRALQAGAAVGQHVQVVRATGVDAATLARQLAADPEVLYAVPNGRKQRVAAPSDPLYPAAAAGARAGGPDSGQWYLRAPDATIRSASNIEAAWDITRGSVKVVVAVLDTGVRFDHPDLRRRLLRGHDFVANATVANDGDGRDDNPTDPGDWVTASDQSTSAFSNCSVSDSSWHGTSTASLIGAATSNGVGMAGAAPGARVLPVRVLGKCYGADSDIVAGMRWAAGLPVDGVPANPQPAKVINLSLGGSGACSRLYQDTVNEIVAAGVVIVAAAGNSAGGSVNEPANCSGVIGVLALRHAGTKVGFSDLGTEISIAAPGGNCINTTAGSQCLYPVLAATNAGTRGAGAHGWSDAFSPTVGTSFSSPLVAAVAALMLSREPGATPAQIRDALRASARPFPTSGADNGAGGAPVNQCQAPAAGRDQLQCYCNTTYCGAGMLDARAAVAAIGTRPFMNLSQRPLVPEPGDEVTVEISGLQVVGGEASLYAWSLSATGGIVNAFTSSTNASSARLSPGAEGQFAAQLDVTDSSGQMLSDTTTVRVMALPTPDDAPAEASSGDSGGGGAASGLWVAGVGLAAFVLGRIRMRAAGRVKAGRRKA